MKNTSRSKPPRLSVPASSTVIDALGGVTAVSKVCEISTAAVAQWRRYGIPKARLQYLRERFREMPIMHTKEVRSL